MTTRFACFTRKAQQATTQFTALMGLLSDPVELADSFKRLKDKAPGVDGVRKADYADGIDGKLESLSTRLRQLAYRPQPVRRVYIPTFQRIIHRFLKAGVMEDGVVKACEEGTPQGGLVSPVLANIYLHYVLDLWFEKRFARSCPGKAYLVRYADDLVVCCQSELAAHQFVEAVKERLAKFGLELSMEKTRILRFGSGAKKHCHREGDQRPKTFDFLGFTHYVSASRSGRFKVGRKTARGRFVKKLAALNVRMSQMRLSGGKAMMEYFIMQVRGHYQYYGVSDNVRSLRRYYEAASRILFKWLNRRSQRRSVRWERFSGILIRETPRPRIVHNFYPLYA